MEGQRHWAGYAWAVGATAACSIAGLAMSRRFDLVNIAMMYLLAVVFIALRYSRGPAIVTSVLCVATFDFLFVPPRGTFAVDDVQYLFTFGIMLAVALVISGLVESVQRQVRAQAALEIEAETERIRNALLASISHDLRTPLAVISGASSSLAQSGEWLSVQERNALATSIFHQSRELSERVAKVLQMTRLESSAIKLDRDWAAPSEIAESALNRLGEQLVAHRVIADLPGDLPLIRVDATLIEQALGNLLENAAKHTPPGTVVRLGAQKRDGELVISVEDFSSQLREIDVERIFEKFDRGPVEVTASGVGLGLAICRAIVRLHGGKIWAERVPAGGTAFRFTIPLENAPTVPTETITQ